MKKRSRHPTFASRSALITKDAHMVVKTHMKLKIYLQRSLCLIFSNGLIVKYLTSRWRRGIIEMEPNCGRSRTPWWIGPSAIWTFVVTSSTGACLTGSYPAHPWLPLHRLPQPVCDICKVPLTIRHLLLLLLAFCCFSTMPTVWCCLPSNMTPVLENRPHSVCRVLRFLRLTGLLGAQLHGEFCRLFQFVWCCR